MHLPLPKFVTGGVIAIEADLRVLKDVVAGEGIPRLASGIDAAVDTLTVGAGEGARLPDGNFTVRLEAETIFVATRTGDVCLSLTRGVDGSTAVAHVAGERVNAFISAAHHNRLAAEIIAIEKRLRLMPYLGPNLVSNPSFEANTAGWHLAFGGDAATRVAGGSHGAWSVKGVPGRPNSGLSQLDADVEPVSPGSNAVFMGVDVRVDASAQRLWIGIEELNAAKVSVVWNPFIANGVTAGDFGLVSYVWKRLSGQVSLNIGTAFVRIHLRGNTGGLAGAWAAFDDVYLGEMVPPVAPTSS